MENFKLKYRSFVGEKHPEIAHKLIDSDIETFAIAFAEHYQALQLHKTSVMIWNKLSEKRPFCNKIYLYNHIINS